MDIALIVFLAIIGGISAGVLIGIAIQGGDTRHLCKSCNLRHTSDFCNVCSAIRSRRRIFGPAEPLAIPKSDVSKDSRARSNWGYTPLYQRPGFGDLYKKDDEEVQT